MWTNPEAVAKRFPLVARFRPACLPLPARISKLIELADAGERHSDPNLASTVYNQSALLASDLGLPNLAREMCHQHATTYLQACPLPAKSAIRGLEPLVNLARLQIRAGEADDGRHRLTALYEAVGAGDEAAFEGIAVPVDLLATVEERREVRAWLWRVLLADGSRTLTTTGRWREALAHIEKHRGVGTRMLDGRQVAVLAALTAGNIEHTSELLASTIPGDPWEQAVTACLTVLCRQQGGQPVDHDVSDLVNVYLNREAEPGLTVFDIRLGLTVLDTVVSSRHPASRTIVEQLVHRAMAAGDGYASREILAHPLSITLATDRQTQACRDLVRACALGATKLPDRLHSDLSAALRISDRVIRDSLAYPASTSQ